MMKQSHKYKLGEEVVLRGFKPNIRDKVSNIEINPSGHVYYQLGDCEKWYYEDLLSRPKDCSMNRMQVFEAIYEGKRVGFKARGDDYYIERIDDPEFTRTAIERLVYVYNSNGIKTSWDAASVICSSSSSDFHIIKKSGYQKIMDVCKSFGHSSTISKIYNIAKESQEE